MFRVYVGNLPYSATEDDLARYFEEAGCNVAMTSKDGQDKKDVAVPRMEDGRSKGFGFVTLADEESFQKALGLNGQPMNGRELRINEARPREERPDRRGAPATEPTEAAIDTEDAEDAEDTVDAAAESSDADE